MQDGRKEQFRSLILTSLSQSFIMTFNFITDQSMHGLKANSKAIVQNINGWMKEQMNGSVTSFQFLLIPPWTI